MNGLIGRRVRVDFVKPLEGEVVTVDLFQDNHTHYVLVLLDDGQLLTVSTNHVHVLPRDYQGPLR